MSTAVDHDGGPASIVRTNSTWQNTGQSSQSCDGTGKSYNTMEAKILPCSSTERRMICALEDETCRHVQMILWWLFQEIILHLLQNEVLYYSTLGYNVYYI